MWAWLPDIILEQVYDLLTPRQRFACSLVCQHWYEVFHSPRLWRHIILSDSSFTRRRYTAFSGYRDEISHRRLQLYLSNVGHHCQILTFHPVTNFYNLHEYLRVLSCFIEFFDEYSFPLLRRLQFTFACESRAFNEVEVIGTGGQVLEEICRLLRDLRDLTHMTLNHLLLDVSDSFSLLDDVIINCGSTLVSVELLNVTKRPSAVRGLSDLTSITQLTLTRAQLTGAALLALCRRTQLSRLVIVDDKYSVPIHPLQNSDHVIPASVWLSASQLNPSLRVRLEFRREPACVSQAEDDVMLGDDVTMPDGAPVDSIVYAYSSSRITMQQVCHVAELYANTLCTFAHTGRGRGVRSRSFHDRADTALLFLIRNCPRLKRLAIHERVSTATLLLLASLGKCLEELYVRKNAVILRCDWSKDSRWTGAYWSWLKDSSRSYEDTEREIGQCLHVRGTRWKLLPDCYFRWIRI